MDQQLAFNNDHALRKKAMNAMRAVRSGKVAREKFCDTCDEKFGIPKRVASLIWGIPYEYRASPIFLSIRVGANLSLAESKFFHWLLLDPEFGVTNITNEQGKPIIQAIGNLCQLVINNTPPSKEEWLMIAQSAWEVASELGEASDNTQEVYESFDDKPNNNPEKLTAVALYCLAAAAEEAVITAAFVADVYCDAENPKEAIRAFIDAHGYSGDAKRLSTGVESMKDPDTEAELACTGQLLKLVS